MEHLASLGIETLTLDVQSESSIAACVEAVPSLDILVNNAGGLYLMPVTDIPIAEAKELFDINVWSPIAVTQAFLPLLLKSPKGMIVTNTSAAVAGPIPFQSVYNASKAALAMFSDTLRLELQPFGITVVNLKTGYVKSNLVQNTLDTKKDHLPKGSIYEPVRELVEQSLRQEKLQNKGIPAQQWAKEVVQDLLKASPPPVIWRGETAFMAWMMGFLPSVLVDGFVKKLVGLDVIQQTLQKLGR